MREPQRESSSIVGSEWQRSSYCASGSCVEVKFLGPENGVLVRDSKQADGAVLSFDAQEWRAFVAGVRDSEFEV
ncbi:hypothetical protein GCM10022223_03320 [Kineosporia mesophila]|uniref:DUF397 domain-containing protein n=1 Tax=Kineosporia mesophila TaxID=566012 RepID=A0ABP6YWD7_9ACTN